MKVFLATLILVGLCILGLGVNIFFRKKDFPKYDVGSNEEMKKRGIRCYKDEDAAIHGKTCPGKDADSCRNCELYDKH